MEGREEEAEGKGMNHTLKENIILIGGLFIAAFAAWMMVLMQSVEDALFTAHFMP